MPDIARLQCWIYHRCQKLCMDSACPSNSKPASSEADCRCCSRHRNRSQRCRRMCMTSSCLMTSDSSNAQGRSKDDCCSGGPSSGATSQDLIWQYNSDAPNTMSCTCCCLEPKHWVNSTITILHEPIVLAWPSTESCPSMGDTCVAPIDYCSQTIQEISLKQIPADPKSVVDSKLCTELYVWMKTCGSASMSFVLRTDLAEMESRRLVSEEADARHSVQLNQQSQIHAC